MIANFYCLAFLTRNGENLNLAENKMLIIKMWRKEVVQRREIKTKIVALKVGYFECHEN